MAKNIVISEELYELLSKLKREGESLNDVIMRSVKYSTSIQDIAGTKIIPKKDWEKLKAIFQEKERKDMERKTALLGEV